MKAVSIYKLTNAQQTIATITEEVIEQFNFKPCGPHDSRKMGFSPNVIDGKYVTQVNGDIILTVVEQTKAPKKYTINQAVEVKKLAYLAEYGVEPNKVRLKEMVNIVKEELLPLTQPDEPKYATVVIKSSGIVLIEANYKKAENLLALLRKAIGSLPVVPFEVECSIGDKLDDLVLEKDKVTFTLGSKAVLVTPEALSHTISKGSLYDSNAKGLVNDGYMTTSLQLELEGTLFTLKDTLEIEGVKFDKELFSELEKGDEAGSVLIKLGEVNKIVKEVIEYLK